MNQDITQGESNQYQRAQSEALDDAKFSPMIDFSKQGSDDIIVNTTAKAKQGKNLHKGFQNVGPTRQSKSEFKPAGLIDMTLSASECNTNVRDLEEIKIPENLAQSSKGKIEVAKLNPDDRELRVRKPTIKGEQWLDWDQARSNKPS